MWIRSQYGNILMDCDFLAVEDHGSKYEVITLSGKSGISIGLGTYSTKEKALKVLNGIQNAISDRVIVDGKLYSPPRRSNESHATTTKRDAIYIMPQDEDVEV